MSKVEKTVEGSLYYFYFKSRLLQKCLLDGVILLNNFKYALFWVPAIGFVGFVSWKLRYMSLSLMMFTEGSPSCKLPH